MQDFKVLYQIKTLEKMIVRSFIKDKEINDSNKQYLCPTPTQMQIIEYILEHGEQDIYQKDLEEVLKLRRATVSGVLQTMEKYGLVERITNTNDSRAKKIILNENAKKLYKIYEKKLSELEEIITKDITKNDLKIFSKVIEKMKYNIEKQNTI